MRFTYHIPTEILFGTGILSQLPQRKLPGKKALIVITADGLMRSLRYLDKTTAYLERCGASWAVYDGVQPNPTGSGVEEARQMLWDEKCDFVLGLGGGSSIDTAKAVALTAKGGNIWAYLDEAFCAGLAREDVLPVVAVATTAGTGTEADPWSVITDEATNRKLCFCGDFLYPTLSIIDPSLMLSIPPALTAVQGLDGLFHLAEGYISKFATPLSRLLSLDGVGRIGRHLSAACRNGADVEARENISYAANVEAGMVQSLSTCISAHKIGETIGGMFPRIPHGASIAAFACEYYRVLSAKAPALFCALSGAMGGDPRDPEGFSRALDALMKACGTDRIRLSEYGVAQADLLSIVEAACAGGFPRDPFDLTQKEVIGILERSYR